MNGVLIDSNVLLDLFTDDKNWRNWSEDALEAASRNNTLFINSVIYSEISIGFNRVEILDEALEELGIRVLEIPREALFIAGKIFLLYRANRGLKSSTLPDFLIGSHALVSEFKLMTRDVSRYRTYFPRVNLINP